MMGKSIKNYFNFSVCFLLLQGFSSCNASVEQNVMDEHTQQHTLNKGVEHLSLKQRDSDTSDESIMKDDRNNLQPSIAQVIFKRACELIPELENPERIKPNIKDRFTWEYSKKIDEYNALKTLKIRFQRSIDGSYDAKMNLALNLLRDMKDFSNLFYDRYGEYSSDGKVLLKTQIVTLLEECAEDPESDPEELNFILKELPDDVSKW